MCVISKCSYRSRWNRPSICTWWNYNLTQTAIHLIIEKPQTSCPPCNTSQDLAAIELVIDSGLRNEKFSQRKGLQWERCKRDHLSWQIAKKQAQDFPSDYINLPNVDKNSLYIVFLAWMHLVEWLELSDVAWTKSLCMFSNLSWLNESDI